MNPLYNPMVLAQQLVVAAFHWTAVIAFLPTAVITKTLTKENQA